MDNPQGWIDGLFTLLISLVAFMLNLYRRKVDKLEESHTIFVKRDDFERYMEQIRDDRQRMHEESQTRLRDIGSDIRAVHVRIDQIYGSNGKNGR
jgi:asparagine synthetase A